MAMEPRNWTKEAENFLKVVDFRYPDWIPCSVGILPATWRKYREALEEIVLRHPRLFPNFKKGSIDFDAVYDPGYRRGRFTDSWGCVWENIEEGMEGIVVGHPLEDWSALENYKVPDPLVQWDRGPAPDWEELRKRFERIKAEGNLAWGGLPHGAMYMRIYYLRGFENFMIDIATEDPRLQKLIDMVLEHNMRLIDKWLEIGADIISFGDDLGAQKSLPISPRHFKKYFTPCFKKMFGRVREAGAYVYLHSDGHILEIMDDLIEAGMNIINPQIRANTLEGLVKTCKGRVCINLDLDRQLFPFATPDEIREHIWTAVKALYMPEGGLMLEAECEPDVPLENIEAICQTLEEVMDYKG